MVQAPRLKIVVLTGPTAIGKSSLAVSIAKKINAEIISADSMQIYCGMDIGTGKVTDAEMEGIKHHLLSFVEPNAEYSVGEYVKDAAAVMADIARRGKVPLIVGGSGLYINALLNGHNFAATPKNQSLRDELKKKLAENGNEYLHEYLSKIDPVSAEKISVNDTRRVIRAIEIFYETNDTKTNRAVSAPIKPYNALTIILEEDRETLYRKINARVDEMLSIGWVDEVKVLGLPSDVQSMQAIGYKEISEFLRGDLDYDSMCEKIKMNTRRYAKRQVTYFKHMPVENKCFYPVSETDKIIKAVENFVFSA